MRRIFPALAALTLNGCSTEYSLSETPEVPVTNAVSGERGAATSGQMHQFKVDPATADRADYLFVVDPSVSMAKVNGLMRAGFESLQPEEFGREARIAVISTTPRAFGPGRNPHPSVQDPEGALRDPGFQKLVQGRDIAAWKRMANADAETACDGWFAPGDKLSDGTPCLQAVTELPLYKANAEAGLLAVKQLLQSQGDEPLFRDGASVNIVIVSDTHDPGLPAGAGRDALTAQRPDYDELVQLVTRANAVASLKVHAIAPSEACSPLEDWAGIGTSYYDVALASGGRIVDVCTTEDYTPIFRELGVTAMTRTHAVLDLGADAGKIKSVQVNGEPIPYRTYRGGRLVRVDNAMAGATDIQVEVE